MLDIRIWRGVACLVLVAGTAVAHEHHDDRIPEGEAISVDPIVSGDLCRTRRERDGTGFDMSYWMEQP